MTTHSGYLLIADISGYTAFLTSSEQDHATPILQSLLTSMVEQVGDPLHLWKMEGDSVLAYSTKQAFPGGETFLGICENLYNAFAMRRQNIIANTSCPCRACANVSNLDLKIIAHHGSFEEMEIGPIKDISGADVILVHRMAKTDVKAVTGINSYALFSDAAAKAMDIQTALRPFSQNFEHFGEVEMQVYDLARAWESFHAQRERHYLKEEDGIFIYRHTFPHSPALVWEALMAPELKKEWLGMLAVTVDRPEGRIGPGSSYHCAHSDADFYYWVTDWEPFSYFSTSIQSLVDGKLFHPETYQVIPGDGETVVRYTIAGAYDEAGTRYPDAEQPAVDFLKTLWPAAFTAMDELLSESK
jgi:hypothetical protein